MILSVLSMKDFCFSESMEKQITAIFDNKKEKCLRDDISKKYLQKTHIM